MLRRMPPGPPRALRLPSAACHGVLLGCRPRRRPPAGAGAEPRRRRSSNSALDAPLFYQLLIGEIELRDGEAGTAYQVHARRGAAHRDEQLFRRATEIALQARAGDQALAAATAWRQAVPESLEALRYQLQILVALNRADEVGRAAAALLAPRRRPSAPALIAALPRLLQRAADTDAGRRRCSSEVLQPYLDAPDTRTAARVAMGRGWLARRRRRQGAGTCAERAQRRRPGAEGPVLLALELLPAQPEAEAIVTATCARQGRQHGVRLVYVRALLSARSAMPMRSRSSTRLTRSEPDAGRRPG